MKLPMKQMAAWTRIPRSIQTAKALALRFWPSAKNALLEEGFHPWTAFIVSERGLWAVGCTKGVRDRAGLEEALILLCREKRARGFVFITTEVRAARGAKRQLPFRGAPRHQEILRLGAMWEGKDTFVKEAAMVRDGSGRLVALVEKK